VEINHGTHTGFAVATAAYCGGAAWTPV